MKQFFKKILKEDSTLSILKVSATVLTAVSMALISTRLTTVVNSLVLIAIVSALSAIVSEFYRVILSVTSLGARKVILTKLQVNPDGSTTEIPIITPEIISENSERSEEETQRANDGAVRRYFRLNPLMKTVVIFAIISAMTIATSYFISSASGKAPVNNFTTVQNPIEAITDTEKQKIIDSAVDTSLSETLTQQEDLQSQIDILEQNNAELAQDLEGLQKEKLVTDRLISDFDSKLKAVEAKLQQGASPSSPAPTATATPTVTLPMPTPSATLPPADQSYE